ncbi:MAG TPA: CoA-binding protein [Bacteroidetes bacterium]|nr:CoA-binding protein [Bacteroidota bacterium]HEX04276.1 CoA-binding protein [Bacteroidota bacterium]
MDSEGRIAIVGLSPKEHRDSHKVAKYLIEHGHDVVPVHPKATEILGRKCYPNLKSVEGPIEVVDVFLNPDRVTNVAEEAVEIGAKYFWLQLGVINDDAAELVRQAGLSVVMDRCIKIEHERISRGS